eukprot:CAMPEP_0184007012 /NCGR_PEP_ID=MMETSP0954-20121128/1063_1 /TAXON_ID=627963 /ORGANISM="Aplanochytrium sp, Strain PBS07" /LENGTH=500 /DNA_ID=CAMNT_0026285727 /DNA_START=168 /DNA_END=1670 /DNA_ORIENTATION=-
MVFIAFSLLLVLTVIVVRTGGENLALRSEENIGNPQPQVQSSATALKEELTSKTVDKVSTPEPKLSLKDIQESLYYWKLDPLTTSGVNRLPSNTQYVLFETDCGGFNNIRMAFEYFVLMAWLTRRTLVLPPARGWYLIDFGPFTRMRPDQTSERITRYGEFFDMEHLRAAVPVITTEEFLKREGEYLDIPSEIRNADLTSSSARKKYKKWLFEQDNEKIMPLEWGPLQHLIYYPSISEVTAQFGRVPKNFLHHRKQVELTADISRSTAIVFPSCKNNLNARFLVQVNTFAAFADEALSRSYKRMLRDHVHYVKAVFDIAARVIKVLGPWKYSSLHVRRNDLQYKEVFMGAEETLKHIQPLLNENEVLYIATDEKGDEFFAPIAKEHEIYRWADFFKERGQNALTGVKIPRKLEGCIEQVICAMGRTFFGTLESTFTSYIFRLRGYLDAPVKETYFHTLQYSGDLQRDRSVTYSRKPLKGQIYKSEHPSIWEDASSAHTTW